MDLIHQLVSTVLCKSACWVWVTLLSLKQLGSFTKASWLSVPFWFPLIRVTIALDSDKPQGNVIQRFSNGFRFGLYFRTWDGQMSVSLKFRKSHFLKVLLLSDKGFSECILLCSHVLLHTHTFYPVIPRGCSAAQMRVKCFAPSLNVAFSRGIKKYFSSSPVLIFTACPGIQTGNLLVPSSGL